MCFSVLHQLLGGCVHGGSHYEGGGRGFRVGDFDDVQVQPGILVTAVTSHVD